MIVFDSAFKFQKLILLYDTDRKDFLKGNIIGS